MKPAEEIDKLSLKLLDNINKLSFLDLPSFRLKTYDCLEQIPRNIQCVYFIFSKKFGLLYIGKTNDLNRRLSKPYQGQIHDGLLAIMLFKDCEVYYFESRKETLSLIEEALIFKHSPALNRSGVKPNNDRRYEELCHLYEFIKLCDSNRLELYEIEKIIKGISFKRILNDRVGRRALKHFVDKWWERDYDIREKEKALKKIERDNEILRARSVAD